MSGQLATSLLQRMHCTMHATLTCKSCLLIAACNSGECVATIIAEPVVKGIMAKDSKHCNKKLLGETYIQIPNGWPVREGLDHEFGYTIATRVAVSTHCSGVSAYFRFCLPCFLSCFPCSCRLPCFFPASLFFLSVCLAWCVRVCVRACVRALLASRFGPPSRTICLECYWSANVAPTA